VEGIVPRTVWYWGSDSSVINDPLEDLGHTSLYAGLPSGWGSMDGDCMFSLHFVGGLLIGDSNRHKQMNKETGSKNDFKPSTAMKAQ